MCNTKALDALLKEMKSYSGTVSSHMSHSSRLWILKGRNQFSSIHLLSCVQLFVTPWTTAHQASLSITNSQGSATPVSIILCHPLLLLPSVFPSIRVFSSESALCIRWPKDWSFSFYISPPNEHPGLSSLMDWLDLLVVKGTLKSLLQIHSSTALILRCSVFFIFQLSHPYMTTGKTIALTSRPLLAK